MQFHGVSEYLEDLVVRIDTPSQGDLNITLFDQFIPDTAKLVQFIQITPKLRGNNEAHVAFHPSSVRLTLPAVSGKGLQVSCEVVDWQVSSMVQVCTSSLSRLFRATVERLYICDTYAFWRGDIRVEENDWRELLRPFISVKNLYLSHVIVRRIAPALQEIIGERVAGVLPALETLFLEDVLILEPFQEAIGSFVSGRQFSSHPVAVSYWKRKWMY